MNACRPNGTPEWIMGNCDLASVKCVHQETDWIVFDIAPFRANGATVALVLSDTTLVVPASSDIRAHCVEMALTDVADAVQRYCPQDHMSDTSNCPQEAPAADPAPSGFSARRTSRPGRRSASIGLPVGLQNSGTSCFLNSVMVCLAHLPAWGKNLCQQIPVTDLGPFFTALRSPSDNRPTPVYESLPYST